MPSSFRLFSCFSCVKGPSSGNRSGKASGDQETPLKAKKTPLPDSFAELDLSHCSLNDVPAEVFAHERTLESLDLESNNIRDLPRQLFHCHELRRVNLADNDLHSLPQAISSWSNLSVLDLSKNVLSDVPESIKSCRALRIFDLSVNPLQRVPEACTQLLSLTELYLNDAFLEFLPANFGRLAGLRILELRENSLSSLPKSLNRLAGSLERLDLGENEFTEVPEVVGSLSGLKELWMDGNRIWHLPAFVGNLANLDHLDVSLNHLTSLAAEGGLRKCSALTYLALSSNDLAELPDDLFQEMATLVTLKLDDNRLEYLPSSLGKMSMLQELFLGQNRLKGLPASVGLLRKLHTLNADDNNLECLPTELGSCSALRVLNVHGNSLTALPPELDHIVDLAVIDLTANAVRNLPMSFTKLTRLNALWLSPNQHKPLVQLNTETDPETGQRVLTNFMLPQTDEGTVRGKVRQGDGGDPDDHDDDDDTLSISSGAWEEERLRKSLIKWKETTNGGPWSPDWGDQQAGQSGGLRREPTPFPKEMRALAKRAQNLRSKVPSSAHEALNFGNEEKLPESQPAPVPGPIRSDVAEDAASPISQTNVPEKPATPEDVVGVEIKEAKVTRPSLSSSAADQRRALETAGFGGGRPEQPPPSRHTQLPSPDKSRSSRDSGVATPSERTSSPPSTSCDVRNGGNGAQISTRNPSDPLPQAPVLGDFAEGPAGEKSGKGSSAPPGDEGFNLTNRPEKSMPPPYHIAASMSKHAESFQGLPSRQHDLELHSSVRGHDRSPAGGGPTPTTSIPRWKPPTGSAMSPPVMMASAASIETTVPRNPLAAVGGQQQMRAGKNKGDLDDDSERDHAQNLRKVSEQLLGSQRLRQQGNGGGSSNSSSASSRPGSIAAAGGAAAPSPVAFNHFRSSIPVMANSASRIPTAKPVVPGAGSGNGHHRPESPAAPSAAATPTGGACPASPDRSSSGSIPSEALGSPLNTVGLPIDEDRPKGGAVVSEGKNGGSGNGLLDTIERAAMSDDEGSSSSPVPAARALEPHLPPGQPQWSSRIPLLLSSSPNSGTEPCPDGGGPDLTAAQTTEYENVALPLPSPLSPKPGGASKLPKLAANPMYVNHKNNNGQNSPGMPDARGDRISTSQFVAASPSQPAVAGNVQASSSKHGGSLKPSGIPSSIKSNLPQSRPAIRSPAPPSEPLSRIPAPK